MRDIYSLITDTILFLFFGGIEYLHDWLYPSQNHQKIFDDCNFPLKIRFHSHLLFQFYA